MASTLGHDHIWEKISDGGDGSELPSFRMAAPRDKKVIADWTAVYWHGVGDALLMHKDKQTTDQIEDRLFLGGVADAAYLPFLREAGITHIICCAAEVIPVPYKDANLFEYHCLVWEDDQEQADAIERNGFRELQQAMRFIHDAISGESEGVVLVHCVMGQSRSASVVVAYMMEYRGLRFTDAASLVCERRRVALGTFEEVQLKFEGHLQERSAV